MNLSEVQFSCIKILLNFSFFFIFFYHTISFILSITYLSFVSISLKMYTSKRYSESFSLCIYLGKRRTIRMIIRNQILLRAARSLKMKRKLWLIRIHIAISLYGFVLCVFFKAHTTRILHIYTFIGDTITWITDYLYFLF